MEKRKTFHGRQVGKKRLLPIVFPLFLFLLIPLNGYGDDTPMPEVVQQNSTRITGVVKDAYGEPVIGANVKVVGTTQGTITDFEGKFSINVSGFTSERFKHSACTAISTRISCVLFSDNSAVSSALSA